jgi:hypothetical protein
MTKPRRMRRLQGLKSQHNRVALILGMVLGALIVLPFVKRIPQDPSYHQFADARTMLGIPNALNVLSNLPFFFVGAIGLWMVLRQRGSASRFLTREEAYPYIALFAGVMLVTFGSGYYHLNPNNATLLWDRLPMSVAFMGLLAGLVGERIEVRWGTRLLPILLVLGAASVLYWYHSELVGRGDLRPYAIVQFLPMLLIPILIWIFPPRYTGAAWYFGVFGFYAAAKFLEMFDPDVFDALHFVSGHTLKHCAAAAAIVCLVVMLWKRRPWPQVD